MTHFPQRLCEIACAAATAGGRVAREAFGKRVSVSIKPDASEVTEIDVAAEHAVIAYVRSLRPDDAFIGEEGVAADSQSDSSAKTASASSVSGTAAKQDLDDSERISWVIDPIDGTRNFIRGVPLFTCSVAALRGGTPVAAAIYDPMSDTMYSAWLGGGSFANGLPLARLTNFGQRSATRNPTPIVAIPSAYRSAGGPFVRRIIENSVVRSLGCATLHLVHVAIGGIDAAYMNNCKIWDIAAGALILSEVGGEIRFPNGEPIFPATPATLGGGETPNLSGAPAMVKQLIQWRAEAGVTS